MNPHSLVVRYIPAGKMENNSGRKSLLCSLRWFLQHLNTITGKLTKSAHLSAGNNVFLWIISRVFGLQFNSTIAETPNHTYGPILLPVWRHRSHLCIICTSVDAEGRSSHFRLFIASLLCVIVTNSVSGTKLWNSDSQMTPKTQSHDAVHTFIRKNQYSLKYKM